MAASRWNQALRAGKITPIDLGPYTHFGKASYFNDETRLPDGSTYREKVITTIRERLAGAGLLGGVEPASKVSGRVVTK